MKQQELEELFCQVAPFMRNLQASNTGPDPPEFAEKLTRFREIGIPKFIVSTDIRLEELKSVPFAALPMFNGLEFAGIKERFSFESARHNVNFQFLESREKSYHKPPGKEKVSGRDQKRLPIINRLWLDHPFMFFYYDTRKCEMLFVGSVMESRLVT